MCKNRIKNRFFRKDALIENIQELSFGIEDKFLIKLSQCFKEISDEYEKMAKSEDKEFFKDKFDAYSRLFHGFDLACVNEYNLRHD